MVASAVVTLVLTSLVEVYYSVAKEWERQQGQASALVATSTACTRLSDYISQATGATVLTRYTSGDTLALNLPADTANGIYVPTWSSGKVQYRSGNWIIFYLSDSTGSYSHSGDILWAASMTWAGFPGSVVPDTSWSLYFNQSKGNIQPLSSIQFTYTSDDRPRVTVTATSTYQRGTTQAQIQQSRTICLQNVN